MKNSNICREAQGSRTWPLKCLVAVLSLGCVVNVAGAKEPTKGISTYVRERFGSDKGFPSASIYAIAQSSDGYLWIGTAKGLVRFDGWDFKLFQRVDAMSSPMGPVLALIADADNNLWVRLEGQGLLRYHDGKFEDVSLAFAQSATRVSSMCRGKDGEILFAGFANGIFRYQDGKFLEIAPRVMPGFLAVSIAETPDGMFLLGGRDGGLYEESATQPVAGLPELRDSKINSLLPIDAQRFWIGTDRGLLEWDGKEVVKSSIPALKNVQVLAITKDRRSNTWIGTDDALVRIDASGATYFGENTHVTGGVTAVFEDREGNIWTGSSQGLERFREGAFRTYSVSDGFPSESNGPVYIDDEKRPWFAPSEGGLYLLQDGRAQAVKTAGLDRDVVYSITGGEGHIWVGRQNGGLTRLQYNGWTTKDQSYTAANGLAQNSVYAVYEGPDGGVWAGTLSGGVSRFADGRFTTYTTANGLASNTINSILETDDHTVWFATPAGISSLKDGHWKAYSESDGLPSEDVNCLFEDSSKTLWAGTSGGLTLFRSGHFQVPGNLPQILQEQVLGIAEDRNGWLWIATANHVLRARRDNLANGALGAVDLREYDTDDGLLSVEGVKRSTSVVSGPLGKIWFSLSRGLSVADPSHLATTSAPAIAHVEALSVDGNPIQMSDLVHVPPSPKRITLAYTGLSLAEPERIRFRYFLEGFDRGWGEPVANREATYTNLGKGPYRFRVMASNSDGLWNGAETAVSFEIAPAVWQTWWFQVSGVLIAILIVVASLRLRVLQLERQMNMRFEERLAERTRIARELHDSLLQGFQGLMFRLQAIRDLLPNRPTEAAQALDRTLDRADEVIAEGRGTVEDLRHVTPSSDIVQALTALGEELAPGEQNDRAAGLRVLVEGKQRDLDPLLRDGVYRIAREAFRNAVRHANAQNIEAEITYGESHFLLRIRDDGGGIDRKVLDQGSRTGHWGLPGMRERAQGLGGQLEVWSESGAGTEVELTIPASVAYGKTSFHRKFWNLGKKN